MATGTTSGLFLFEQSIPGALDVYVQNNTTGFPIYETDEEAQSVYRDSYPQRIRLNESVAYGDLLHVSYTSIGVVASKASALNPELFANSVALESGSAGALVLCGVRGAVLRDPKFFQNGTVFLAETPGTLTLSIGVGEITQCVGWSDGGIYHFHYHAPALNNPLAYPDLEKNYG